MDWVDLYTCSHIMHSKYVAIHLSQFLAFRGYTVRKAYGPLINKSTGKIDVETAEFLRRFAKRWRSRSIFQVLLQYRAIRYQDLVNFSQQVILHSWII